MQEPSWVELANENRSLRAEIDKSRSDWETFRDSIEARFNTLSDKVNAQQNVIEDIARQAPTGFIPVLNPQDVAILHTVLPPQWLNNNNK